jgi:hypothetical protein
MMYDLGFSAAVALTWQDDHMAGEPSHLTIREPTGLLSKGLHQRRVADSGSVS